LVVEANPFPSTGGATPAINDDTGLLFDLPSVGRKKVSAAFDGGRITSDGGVALLALPTAGSASSTPLRADRRPARSGRGDPTARLHPARQGAGRRLRRSLSSGRPLDFCEKHGLDFLFGVTGAKALAAKVEDIADPIRVERAKTGAAAVRGFPETRHKAGSWKHERRVVARIEATRLGLDIRCVVTSLEALDPETIYATLYCARGQA
jgi:hypothetical protein